MAIAFFLPFLNRNAAGDPLRVRRRHTMRAGDPDRVGANDRSVRGPEAGQEAAYDARR